MSVKHSRADNALCVSVGCVLYSSSAVIDDGHRFYVVLSTRLSHADQGAWLASALDSTQRAARPNTLVHRAQPCSATPCRLIRCVSEPHIFGVKRIPYNSEHTASIAALLSL